MRGFWVIAGTSTMRGDRIALDQFAGLGVFGRVRRVEQQFAGFRVGRLDGPENRLAVVVQNRNGVEQGLARLRVGQVNRLKNQFAGLVLYLNAVGQRLIEDAGAFGQHGLAVNNADFFVVVVSNLGGLDLFDHGLARIIQNRDHFGDQVAVRIRRLALGRPGLRDRGELRVFAPEAVAVRVEVLSGEGVADRLPRIADVQAGVVALPVE
jgi:hypothetical protein